MQQKFFEEDQIGEISKTQEEVPFGAWGGFVRPGVESKV